MKSMIYKHEINDLFAHCKEGARFSDGIKARMIRSVIPELEHLVDTLEIEQSQTNITAFYKRCMK